MAGPPGRQRSKTLGRVAAVLFLGSGLVTLVTLPLPGPSDLDRAGTLIVAVAAVVVGIFAWQAPWDRWPRSATLWLVPPALVLIAAGNVLGGSQPYTFGIFFVVVFVWIGLAHPRWTSAWMAIPAIVAYEVPILILEGVDPSALSTAAVTIPVCVLVGESIAWGIDRLTTTEEALQREREVVERLRTLDQQKRLLMSTASHELRTPITICRGYLDVLDATDDPTEVSETLAVLQDELGRMSRIVEDITTVVRLEDPAALAKRSVGVGELVDGLRMKARPFLDGRLDVTGPPERETITADPERLTQAVLNLLDNAAKYTQGAPVELRTLTSQRSCRFEVTDLGPGILPADADRLFEPFQRGQEQEAGTGLGLAVVGAIARAHQGSAGVRSEGEATTFWIEVPR